MPNRIKKTKKFNFLFILLLSVSILIVVFAVIQTNTVFDLRSRAAPTSWYYSQYGGAWQTSTCKLATYGCFPTSLAMVLKKFNPEGGFNPLKVALDIGNGCTSGTNVTEQDWAIKVYAVNKGMVVKDLEGSDLNKNIVTYGSKKFNINLAKEYIDKNYLIILSGCLEYFYSNNAKSSPSKFPHAVVVVDVVPENNRIITLDPTKEWDYRRLNPYTAIKSCPGSVNGWVSAYALKKS